MAVVKLTLLQALDRLSIRQEMYERRLRNAWSGGPPRHNLSEFIGEDGTINWPSPAEVETFLQAVSTVAIAAFLSTVFEENEDYIWNYLHEDNNVPDDYLDSQ
jgi:hypothetical protein